ncbi:MAG: glycosyltransferase [Saprospiraceae bacterium]|nr:glycosyltransferase [Saprospiraceae bacterium]
MIETLLSIAFVVATATQLLYWSFIFSKLAFFSSQKYTRVNKSEPVSVIICAKNEAVNLRRNLESILTQSYPDFELIVVNDHSSDNSLSILLEFQRKYPNLCVLNLQEATSPGKKEALSRGIKAAKFDILLLTDADCMPSSPFWIQEMQNVINQDIEICLGYSPYIHAKGFLNLFIRFEAIYTAIQYLSFSLIGQPYMGVGRNLAYRKGLFFKNKGFQSHQDLASGDDDLFVNAVATNQNTKINLKSEAFIYSSPKESWRGYYRQKSRHLTTGTHYKLVHQMLLGMLSASHFGHYAFGLCLAFFPAYQSLVVACYLARMGVVWCLSARILSELKDKTLVPWIPVLDVAYQFYYLTFAPILLIGKTDQWK